MYKRQLLDDTTEEDGTPALISTDSPSMDWAADVDAELGTNTAITGPEKDLETNGSSGGANKVGEPAISTAESDKQADLFLKSVGEAWKKKQSDPELVVYVKSPRKAWTEVQPQPELIPKGKKSIEKMALLPLAQWL